MKASTERKLMRWIHIIFSVPIIGYIYGPVASIPASAMAVRVIIFPALTVSGLWMWKGHVVKRWFKRMITK